MCGIVGIMGREGKAVQQFEIDAMCKAIVHRGPDDRGTCISGPVGLGMQRLSIIDLDHGQQPVWNEDHSACVVLNGEIYNYRELRKQLQDKGHVFRTSSDTEVIVHLYEEHGIACLDQLRGMFAFALWDVRRQRLFMARDRLGIKPLYYGEFGGRLVFASELKAILALPEVERTLNWESVSHLLSFLTTPSRESIIKGVHKLEPGNFLLADAAGGLHVQPYWSLQFEADRDHDRSWFIDRLRDQLEDSVRLCMVSDVPVGAFLSGGLDSSTVVAMMSRLSDTPVNTFSIGFSESAHDESRHAREVARLFGTQHHEQILAPDVMSMMEDLGWYLDEPFGDSSAIPTYMVSRLAASRVKVVLSGDGGDELFAGYDRYQVEARERRYRHIPALLRNVMGAVGWRMPEGMKGRNFLRHIALDGAERYMDANTMFRPDQQRALFRPEFAEQVLAADPMGELVRQLEYAGRKSPGDWLAPLQSLDIRQYLPLDILTKVDRMSMAHSIETRVPLLDHPLVELAATVPPEWRMQQGTTKYLLKEAMRGVLPDHLIDRRKQGFAIPLGSWFRGQLDGYAEDLLLSSRACARGIFEPEAVRDLLRLHRAGRPMDLQLWTLMTFEMWCRTFLDAAQAVQPAAESLGAVPQQSGRIAVTG